MKTLKQVTSAPKKVASHVYNRRGRYGTAAGFIAGHVLMTKLSGVAYKDALTFIEEKGLIDEYFVAGPIVK